MKILLTASTVPASHEDPVPRFVLDQARAMAAADPDISIVMLAPHTPASHGRSWPQRETDDGRVTQHRYRYTLRRWETLAHRGIMPAIAQRPARVLLVPALIICQVIALWRLVRRERPDVIYAHWFTPQALSARIVSRVTGVPFGFTTHASDVVVWRRFGALGRRVVRGTVRRASFMSAVSYQTADKLLAFFEGDERARVAQDLRIIPMGVVLDDAAWPHGDPHHAVIIARLVEKKGIHVLLEAWPAVLAEVPDAALTIAGDGPLRAEIAAHARRLSIDVSMPGFVSGAAKREVLATAGVVVQPSVVAADGDADGLPVALLEGIVAGRIGVASDASGAQDLLVDGVNGYLTPSGDVEALAKALIAAMTLSPGERAAMEEAAREVAAAVAWPTVARQHREMMGA